MITVTAGDDGDIRKEHERERGRKRVGEEEMEEHRHGLLDQPRTPEPGATMGMNMHDFRDEDNEDTHCGVHDPDLLSVTTASSPPAVRPLSPPLSWQQNTDNLTTHPTTLADQLENALAVSRSLICPADYYPASQGQDCHAGRSVHKRTPHCRQPLLQNYPSLAAINIEPNTEIAHKVAVWHQEGFGWCL